MPKVGDLVFHIGRDHERQEAAVFSELIRGETSRSWVLGDSWDQTKYPKRSFPPEGKFLTLEAAEHQMQTDAWMDKHATKIGLIVRPNYSRLKLTMEQMKKIAEIIGYNEGEA